MQPFRCVSVLACVLGVAAAQAPIGGRIAAAGQPVPGAEITATAGGERATVYSAEDGSFSLGPLPAGPAALEVTMFGFAPKRVEVGDAQRREPLTVTLELLPFRAPAAAPVPPRAVRQNFQTVQAVESAVNNSLAPAAPAADQPGDGATESFLIQGSLSRGLQQIDSAGAQPGPFFGPGPGGDETGAPGAGFPSNPTAEAGGGPPGMGGGGPGGGFGARGGFGGRGGPGGRLAQMTPEQRRRIQQRMRERMAAGGGERVFGNRAGRRQQQSVRGGLFFRYGNSALDASPFALNGRATQKPSYSNATFGGSLGGLFRIPKLIKTERTFFFLHFNATRSRAGSTMFGVVPTEAERAGDFSRVGAAIYDPLTGLPFEGNRIPAQRIDRAAAGLLALIPLPNQPGAIQNYRLTASVPRNVNSLNFRLNQPLGSRDRLAFGAGLQSRNGENLQLFGFRDATTGSGQNYNVMWSHNFSPQLIQTVRTGFNRNRNELVPAFGFGEDIAGQLGIAGVSRDPANYGPPNLGFTNFGGLTEGARSNRAVNTYSLGDAWIVARGSHTLRTGVDYRRLQLNTIAEQNARGTFLFTGLATSGFDAAGLPLAHTGYDLADFLLGLPQQTSVRYAGADTYLRSNSIAAYVQDEWRARANLSFNLGLRYEYFAPYQEKYGRMANLDLSPDFTAAAVVTPGAVGPFTGKFPDGLVDPDRNNFSPRLGIAWRPWTKRQFTVRAGYSIFYDPSVFNRVPSALAAQPPFAVTGVFTTSPADVLTIENGFRALRSFGILNTYAVNRHYPAPYAQTWTFSLEQPLPGGFIAEAGYLGTKGTRLVISRLPNRALPGSPADAELRRRIADAVGFTWDSPEGDAIFHAAQLRLTRRFRRGLSFSALYTLSKSIDNGSVFGGVGQVVAQNENDLAAERGLSSFDRRHQLSLSAVIGSPYTSNGGRRLNNPVLSALARDWSAMLRVTAQSGTPFTARVLGNVADPGGSGAAGNARADATGLPIDAAGAYFNTAAFGAPAPGAFGNAGRNTIPGQAFFTLNLSFGRSFQLGESARRRRLDLRAEASNLTNHVNVTGLGTVVNSRDFGLATVAGDMRSVTLSARVMF